MMIKEYKSKDDYNIIIETSKTDPVFLFKHSTACPISAAALQEFQAFVKTRELSNCWQVLVIEDRPLSLDIADRSGVTHASPQVIIFNKGEAVWNRSHMRITGEKLGAAVNGIKI